MQDTYLGLIETKDGLVDRFGNSHTPPQGITLIPNILEDKLNEVYDFALERLRKERKRRSDVEAEYLQQREVPESFRDCILKRFPNKSPINNVLIKWDVPKRVQEVHIDPSAFFTTDEDEIINENERSLVIKLSHTGGATRFYEAEGCMFARNSYQIPQNLTNTYTAPSDRGLGVLFHPSMYHSGGLLSTNPREPRIIIAV